MKIRLFGYYIELGKIVHKTLKKEYEYIDPHEEYNSFFERLDLWVNKRPDEVKLLLDFMMEVVRRDLQMDLLTEIYYKGNSHEITHIIRKETLPIKYIDQTGIIHDLISDETRHVNITDKTVVVIPWNRPSMRDAIINVVKNGFKYDKDNHMNTRYFKGLDVCFAYNGNHHISAGIIEENDEIIVAEVQDITKLFPHVYTNGEQWYSVYTEEPITSDCGNSKVFDFRMAVLYELARRKYNLENT